jgi:hypothetical protein
MEGAVPDSELNRRFSSRSGVHIVTHNLKAHSLLEDSVVHRKSPVVRYTLAAVPA